MQCGECDGVQRTRKEVCWCGSRSGSQQGHSINGSYVTGHRKLTWPTPDFSSRRTPGCCHCETRLTASPTRLRPAASLHPRFSFPTSLQQVTEGTAALRGVEERKSQRHCLEI